VHNASLTLDPAFRIAEVDPRIFGSFVEHMGRCVYSGIYEPDHPTADELGFRQDVAGLVHDLGVPLVRYPGGNFVSGYNWEDGVGPRDRRPTRLDGAWRSIESNQVGVDDFQQWARMVGTETMMAVNLGTRGVDAARALVEYCNHPSGTALSDRRRANGVADPYGIKLWCLGNEMDGPWQIGHKTAYEYGRLAKETAKAMRLVDPRIELVACGSSNSRMPTFGTWEATVLAECYDEVDYISMHTYYEEHNGDRDSFLASAVDMDHFIDDVVATADHARAVGRHKKRINISFDEWNVWYVSTFAGEKNLEWRQHPRLIEDTYSVTDAVVVGTLLNSLLRHADRVSIACLAQLVNVIAPIRSEPGGQAWRQTTYHPFALTSKYGRGTVLRVEQKSPLHDTARHGAVPVLDGVAVLDEESVSVTLFLVNRDQAKPIALDVHVGGFPDLRVGEHTTVSDADPEAVNTAERPDRVVPVAQGRVAVDGGRLSVELPPLSWNMLRLLPDRVGRK
jgi:alpha-L-arabinofuranosidase